MQAKKRDDEDLAGAGEADSPPSVTAGSLGRRGWLALTIVLGLALLMRCAYLLAQPGADPFLEHPFVDGKLYLEWARALVAGTHEQEGAFYHAPLYPHVLALFLRLTGDSVRGVFLLQSLLSLGTAGLLGCISARRFGALAGVATAALVAFHQPVVFFAATPMGETLALFLLAGALLLRERESGQARLAAGLVLGLSALARPNFLFVGLVLGAWDLLRKDWRRAGAYAAGAALVLVPVAIRNLSASGHFVPISSNGGVTLYHGNAPDARGIYQAIPGTSGDPERQREETTQIAQRESKQNLDPVEADAWWGARARAARLDDPVGTLRLLLWRTLLSVDNHEHALDYDPLLDANPWRPVLRFAGADVPGGGTQIFLVPFALLFALSTVALVARGARASGGVAVWGPILACLATPALFYVSCRYRLPLAVLLALPAGCGCGVLLRAGGGASTTPKALGAGVAALLLSLFIPSGDLAETGRRQSLSNRLGVLTQAGAYDEAERTGRAALALGDSYELRFNLGYLYTRMQRDEVALDAYGAAFALDATRLEAAREYGVLLARRGRFADATLPLEAAVRDARRVRGDTEVWAALAASYRELGDDARMQDTLRRAAQAGVTLRE